VSVTVGTVCYNQSVNSAVCYNKYLAQMYSMFTVVIGVVV